MKTNVMFIALAIMWLTASASMAADYYVARAGQTPAANFTSWGDAASNIADAVSASGAGDTIWISNGLYTVTGQIVTGERTFRSFNNGSLDRDGTIIDGNYPNTTNRCFYINHANAVVQGFTISNGYYYGSGGYSFGGGGGVYMAAGTLRDCLVKNNTATNQQEAGGAGLLASGANCLVTNCDFVANYSYDRGGGAIIHNGAKIVDSRAWGNTSLASHGGGIYVLGGALAENCVAYSNTGGGMSARTAATIRNCLMWGNGSSMYLQVSKNHRKVIENCTLQGTLGFSWAQEPSTSVYYNCIFYGNSPGSSGGGGSVHIYTNCYMAVTNGRLGSGNITNDPHFVDAAGLDFRLHRLSPCINAGTNRAWMPNAVDLDGEPRLDLFHHHVDMGAYEYRYQGTSITIQ